MYNLIHIFIPFFYKFLHLFVVICFPLFFSFSCCIVFHSSFMCSFLCFIFCLLHCDLNIEYIICYLSPVTSNVFHLSPHRFSLQMTAVFPQLLPQIC